MHSAQFNDDTTFPLEEEIIQQSFMGASILDFNVNLGLNSGGSNLSVRLIEDNMNYGTLLTKDGIRTAVTEGYHAWDDEAFPKSLLANFETGEGQPVGPFYGVRSNGTVDRKNGIGDTIWVPKPGAPVYFKYYDPKDLNEKTESTIRGGEKTFCVENRKDPNMPGSLGVRPKDQCKIAFEFNGILTKFEQQYSTSGMTYTVNIADPREILENTTVILKGFSGRTSPADAHNVVGVENDFDSKRVFEDGWNGYYNILNVFGYFESVEFGYSGVTEAGMIWNDPDNPKRGDYNDKKRGTEFADNWWNRLFARNRTYRNDAGADLQNFRMRPQSLGFGILEALDVMLHGYHQGYIRNNEPFGGPLYYGVDRRNISHVDDNGVVTESYPPFGKILKEEENSEETVVDGVYRYKVDLSQLASLSDKTDKKRGVLPPDFRINTDKISLLSLIQQVCDAAGFDFYVYLDRPSSQVYQNFSYHSVADFIKPSNEENYAGVIRVALVDRVQEGYELDNDFEVEGLIHEAIIESQGGKSGNDDPKGIFTAVDPNAKGEHKIKQSILVSSSIGYEFSDPVTGKMLLGGKRTRVVGVTPLGDKKRIGHSFYLAEGGNSGGDTYAKGYYPRANKSDEFTPPDYYDYDTLPANVKSDDDDVLYEFLPSIETDGVNLRNSTSSGVDTFLDHKDAGWNEYGREISEEGYRDFPQFDFKQNLPSVSNDNYLPFTFPEDFRIDNEAETGMVDPFQFNRVNSFTMSEKGSCSGNVCAYCIPGLNCVPFTCNRDDHQGCCVGVNGGFIQAGEDACVAGSNLWYKKGETIQITSEEHCKNYGAQATWMAPNKKTLCLAGENEFTPDHASNRSGYLDLFPCWGFEQKNVSASHSNIFGDIIEMSSQGSPIKGMFIDDDPYRDFHPNDGIFSNIEFYNPSLGVCINSETGDEIDALKNQPAICECSIQEGLDGGINEDDIGKTINVGDCFHKREAAGLVNGIKIITVPGFPSTVDEIGEVTGGYTKSKFRYHCVENGVCSSHDGAPITTLHEGSAGIGNNLHQTEGSCKGACFKQNLTTDAPEGQAIVAFYTEDVSDGGITKKKGEVATPEDAHWQNHPPGKPRSKIKFIFDDGTCQQYAELARGLDGNDDGSPDNPDQQFIFSPINSSGAVANGDENTFESTGGLYSKNCQALTMRVPYNDYCLIGGDSGVRLKDGSRVAYYQHDIADAKNAEECEEKYGAIGGEWNQFPEIPKAGYLFGHLHQNNNPDSIVDINTGKKVKMIDIPKPGYVNTRHRFATGICHNGNVNDVITTDTVDRECYSEDFDGNPSNLMSYNNTPDELKTLMIPRTATIPVQIGKYFREGVDAPDGYHYATVTELRHAAVSFESWLVYLRELHPHLGCMLYAEEPNGANAWASVCIAAEPVLKAGVGQQALHSFMTLSNVAGTEPMSEATLSQINHAGNKGKAVEYSGDSSSNSNVGKLSTYEFTKMQMELIYQDVKDIATNFYGRKYLVPLPANPTTVEYCTGKNSATAIENEDESENPIVGRYKNKESCELAGYEWGTHVDISQWMNNDSTTEINKWEIVSAGWPGGDVDLKTRDKCINKITGAEVDLGKDLCEEETDDSGNIVNKWETDVLPVSDAYPTNMNFWSDEGNLKSFVIFPSTEHQRLFQSSVNIDFSKIDPEQIVIPELDQDKSTPVCDDSKYGNKVFLEVSVDPKTYWIEDRSFYERIHNSQYWLHRAGDNASAGSNSEKGGSARPVEDRPARFPNETTIFWDTETNGSCDTGEHITKSECEFAHDGHWVPEEDPGVLPGGALRDGGSYAKIGPDETPGKTELNPRPLQEFSLGGLCVSLATGQPEPWSNEETCMDVYDSGGDFANEWIEKNVETGYAKKPYALITLPAQVSYKHNDGDQTGWSYFRPNEFTIPLVNTKNSRALTKAWFMAQSYWEIAFQQLHALSFNLKNAPKVAPDLRRGSFIAAAYKPWHAGVPQESTSYRWGPWAFGLEFGKPDFDIDDTYHPAPFGGELGLGKAAISNISSAVRETQRYYETGSVTLTGPPKYPLGPRIVGDLNKDKKGPHVTDISVNIGTNGINTTYTFSTQRKFGSLEKIYEERLRKVQRELMRSLVRAEQELIRVKRNVDQFR